MSELLQVRCFECFESVFFASCESFAAKCLLGDEVFKCCKVPGRWRGFKVLRSAASWRVGKRAALIDWKSIFSGKESQQIQQLYSFWGFEV